MATLLKSQFRLIQARGAAYWRRWLRTRRPWKADRYDTMPRELTPAEFERYQEIMARHDSAWNEGL
jgi:hypothetical protein